MRRENVVRIQEKLDWVTHKWWFFLLFLILFFVPSYGSKGLDPREAPQFAITVVSNALIYSYPSLFPVFKVVPILLILSIVFLGNKMTRVFNIYVATISVLFALFQTMAFTEEYGFAVLTGNLASYSVVAVFWIWEVVAKQNDFTPQKRPPWKYWVVPLAFLAFWYPVDLDTLMPDFAPIYILTSQSGLTYCMMTAVYLAILTLYYPKVNRSTLRATSFAGIITGVLNVMQFFLRTRYSWWMGVLHLPLLTISVYAFVLSFSKIQRPKG